MEEKLVINKAYNKFWILPTVTLVKHIQHTVHYNILWLASLVSRHIGSQQHWFFCSVTAVYVLLTLLQNWQTYKNYTWHVFSPNFIFDIYWHMWQYWFRCKKSVVAPDAGHYRYFKKWSPIQMCSPWLNLNLNLFPISCLTDSMSTFNTNTIQHLLSLDKW